MAVIMVSTLKVKDWDALAEYRKGAGPIVRGHGGELLGRSNSPECLHGTPHVVRLGDEVDTLDAGAAQELAGVHGILRRVA